LGIAGEIFLISCAAAIASWLFGAIEIVSVLLLRRWPFRIGMVAVGVEERVGCPSGLARVSGGQIGRVKYRVVEGRQCLFRESFKLFPFPSGMPGFMKGTISWADGRLMTIVRYPVGMAGFVLGWLVAGTTGSLISVSHGDPGGILFLVIVWAVGAFIFIYGGPRQVRRFRQYASELRAVLGGAPVGP